PADLLKEGSHFDLPIALGLLAAMGVLPAEDLEGYSALGELGLDGRISPVAGVLPTAIAASAAGRGLVSPAAPGGAAGWAGWRRDCPACCRRSIRPRRSRSAWCIRWPARYATGA